MCFRRIFPQRIFAEKFDPTWRTRSKTSPVSVRRPPAPTPTADPLGSPIPCEDRALQTMAKEAGIKANRPKRELIKELNGKENQGTSAAVAQASREKLSPTQSSCRTPATAIQATPATSVYSIGVEGLLQTGLAEAEEDVEDVEGRGDNEGEEQDDPVVASLAQELGGVRLVAPLKGLPVSCGTHTRF